MTADESTPAPPQTPRDELSARHWTDAPWVVAGSGLALTYFVGFGLGLAQVANDRAHAVVVCSIVGAVPLVFFKLATGRVRTGIVGWAVFLAVVAVIVVVTASTDSGTTAIGEAVNPTPTFTPTGINTPSPTPSETPSPRPSATQVGNLKTVKVELSQGGYYETPDGGLSIALELSLGDGSQLNISTPTQECTAYPSIGQSVRLRAAKKSYYRITLIEAGVSDASLRIQQVADAPEDVACN